jgi:hypothetical protein
MNLKTKKILALEIVLIAVVFSIGITTFILTFLYNSHKTKKVKLITNKIASISQILDSLNSAEQEVIYTITLNEETFKILHEFDSSQGRHLSYQELKSLIENSKNRKIYFDEYNNKMDFESFYEFEDLIQTHESKININRNKSIYNSIKVNKYAPIKENIYKLKTSEITLLKSIMTKEEQYKFSLLIMIISAVLLLLLRYVYYLLSWSISILFAKESYNKRSKNR